MQVQYKFNRTNERTDQRYPITWCHFCQMLTKYVLKCFKRPSFDKQQKHFLRDFHPNKISSNHKKGSRWHSSNTPTIRPTTQTPHHPLHSPLPRWHLPPPSSPPSCFFPSCFFSSHPPPSPVPMSSKTFAAAPHRWMPTGLKPPWSRPKDLGCRNKPMRLMPLRSCNNCEGVVRRVIQCRPS